MHLGPAAAATLAALLTAVAPAHAAGDLDLLRRHAPVLHYDARDRDHATSVEALVPGARLPRDRDVVALRATAPGMPDVAYGRAVAGRDGRTWLQYWLLYADNPQDRGIVRTGRHEGDWEVVQVALGPDGRPREATFAQHGWAEACPWGGRVYVAHASHASYPRPGVHGRPWPDPEDEAPGDGRSVRPRVEPFGAWARWPGRWGGARARWWVPGEATSPRGPAFQDDGPWRDPAAYHAAARACGSGAPAHPWPVYVTAFAAFLGLVLLITRWLWARGRRVPRIRLHEDA